MSIMPQEPESKSKPTRRKPIPPRVRFEVLRRDNYTCRYCRSTENALTIDHVTPEVLGGTNDPSNLVAACKDCNAGKSSTSPDAATVAQVSDDAVRWAASMQEAIRRTEEGDAALREQVDAIARYWNECIPSYKQDRPKFRLPMDWRAAVEGLLNAGLPGPMLLDAIDVAMSRTNLDNVFRYMLGVANNKLADLQKTAASILAEEDAPEYVRCNGCGHTRHRDRCCFLDGWSIGVRDCSVITTDTTVGDRAHPDHFVMMALSRVVDRPAHEEAATWPYPSELYPTYTGS